MYVFVWTKLNLTCNDAATAAGSYRTFAFAERWRQRVERLLVPYLVKKRRRSHGALPAKATVVLIHFSTFSLPTGYHENTCVGVFLQQKQVTTTLPVQNVPQWPMQQQMDGGFL